MGALSNEAGSISSPTRRCTITRRQGMWYHGSALVSVVGATEMNTGVIVRAPRKNAPPYAKGEPGSASGDG